MLLENFMRLQVKKKFKIYFSLTFWCSQISSKFFEYNCFLKICRTFLKQMKKKFLQKTWTKVYLCRILTQHTSATSDRKYNRVVVKWIFFNYLQLQFFVISINLNQHLPMLPPVK